MHVVVKLFSTLAGCYTEDFKLVEGEGFAAVCTSDHWWIEQVIRQWTLASSSGLPQPIWNSLYREPNQNWSMPYHKLTSRRDVRSKYLGTGHFTLKSEICPYLDPWNVTTPVFRPLQKVPKCFIIQNSIQIHPCNEATPLIRTLWLVPRVARLEGVHCNSYLGKMLRLIHPYSV